MIPSMAQVHMHVISQDFDSPCLKTKKHWNSFNTSYFMPLDYVRDLLIKYGNLKKAEIQIDKDDLLKKDLQCNQCDMKPNNMPELILHLKQHLQ